MSIVLIWFQSSKMYSIVFSFFFPVNKQIVTNHIISIFGQVTLSFIARSYFLPFWLIMKQIHAIFKPTIKCHLKFLSLKLWQIMLWQFHFFQFTIYFVPKVALLRSFFSFRLILPFMFFFWFFLQYIPKFAKYLLHIIFNVMSNKSM